MSVVEIVNAAELVEGWMSREELEWLAYQALTRRAIVEIGSWKGRSTKALAAATPGFVIAVDHWSGSPGDQTGDEAKRVGSEALESEFRRNLSRLIDSGKVIPAVGDSAEIVTEVGRILASKGQLADMLFIDGSHSYDAVKRDISTYLPLVRAGGLVCGHDYASSSLAVVKAVNESLGAPAYVHGSIWSCQK